MIEFSCLCDHLHLHLVGDILVNLEFEFTSILIQLYSALVPIKIAFRCFRETQNLMAKPATVVWPSGSGFLLICDSLDLNYSLMIVGSLGYLYFYLM